MEQNKVVISIIWWYETMRQSGTIIGPTLLLSKHSINFRIFGGWKIDKFNFVNLVLSLLYFLAICLCHAKLCNVSKLYDQILIATKFGWKSNQVYPVSLISSGIFLVLLSVINRIGVLKGKPSNILFIFLSSVILMATNLNTLLLTATDLFDNFNNQLVYLGILRFTQLIAWFLINTLGNFLLFCLVDPEEK